MTDKDKLKEIKKLADAMYYAAFNLTTDASRLKKAMNEYHQFIINEYCKEEPVSKDLEEAAKHYLYSNILYDDVYVGNPTDKDCIEMFKAGAEWQKKTDESITKDLGEYLYELSKQFPDMSFAKLSRIAVRVAKWQKAQIMAKAIDVEVKVDAGGYPYIEKTIELYDYDKDVPLAKAGEKVKVIIIKQE